MFRVNVFISYSREDIMMADGLVRALKEVGINVFSFLHTPPFPGSDFPHEVARHIAQAHFVALLWSGHSAQSDWVHKEIAFSQQQNKRIIPIWLDPSTPLPPSLSNTQAVLAYKDQAAWVLQVRNAILGILQYLQRMRQQRQQIEQLQNQKKRNEELKNLAGGVITLGLLGALISALDDS